MKRGADRQLTRDDGEERDEDVRAFFDLYVKKCVLMSPLFYFPG